MELFIDGSAEPNLMRAPDPTHVLEEGRHGSAMLIPGGCGAAADRECARCRHCDYVARKGRDGRSEGGPGFVIVDNLHNVRPRESEPEGTDEVGTKKVGVAQR